VDAVAAHAGRAAAAPAARANVDASEASWRRLDGMPTNPSGTDVITIVAAAVAAIAARASPAAASHKCLSRGVIPSPRGRRLG
jgi:hypothetical protein